MPGSGPPGVYLAGRFAPDKRAALVGAIVKRGAARVRDLKKDVRLVVLQGELAPKVRHARDAWGVQVVAADADAATLEAALKAACAPPVVGAPPAAAPADLTNAPVSAAAAAAEPKPKPKPASKPKPPPSPVSAPAVEAHAHAVHAAFAVETLAATPCLTFLEWWHDKDQRGGLRAACMPQWSCSRHEKKPESAKRTFLHQLCRALSNQALIDGGYTSVGKLTDAWRAFWGHFKDFVEAGQALAADGGAAARADGSVHRHVEAIRAYYRFMNDRAQMAKVVRLGVPQRRPGRHAWIDHRVVEDHGPRWAEMEALLLELVASRSAAHVAGAYPAREGAGASAHEPLSAANREAACLGVRYAMGAPGAAAEMGAAEKAHGRFPSAPGRRAGLALGPPLPRLHQRGFLEEPGVEDKVARRVEWHATDASTASILADVVHWLCALRATEGEAPTHLDRLAHVVAGLTGGAGGGTVAPVTDRPGADPLALFAPRGAGGRGPLVCALGRTAPGSLEAHVDAWAEADARDPRRVLAQRALEASLRGLPEAVRFGRATAPGGARVLCVCIDDPAVVPAVRARAEVLRRTEDASSAQFAALRAALKRTNWAGGVLAITRLTQDPACRKDPTLVDALYALVFGTPAERATAAPRVTRLIEQREARDAAPDGLRLATHAFATGRNGPPTAEQRAAWWRDALAAGRTTRAQLGLPEESVHAHRGIIDPEAEAQGGAERHACR